MKRLNRPGRYNPQDVFAALQAVPALRNKKIIDPFGREAEEAVFTLGVNEDGIVLNLPDEADEGAVEAVLSALVYREPPDPVAEAQARKLAQRQKIEGAKSVAELRAALLEILES